MILNSKQNMFTIWFPPNFFYPSVLKKWDAVVKRLKLPHQTTEDFLNNCIQSVTIPAIDLQTVSQQQSQFPITYRGGKELEPVFEKRLDVTFKLSEGFISYWILFDQIEEFMKYKEDLVFWPSMYVSFLDLHGLEMMVFEFKQMTPTALSSLDISYSKTAAQFNTFSLTMKYNRFTITRKMGDQSREVFDI